VYIGAIVCMSQIYYVGPIAKMIPGDIGLPVAAAWTALCYPGLRVSAHRLATLNLRDKTKFIIAVLGT
jgi:purine-cytosine permease-like protein